MFFKLITFSFAYSNIELDCDGNKGGWMRITDIDTSKGDACCSGLINYNSYCIGASTTVYYSTHFSQTLQATVIFVVK